MIALVLMFFGFSSYNKDRSMTLATFFLIQYHDTIGFCFDIYRVSHPEN